MIPEILKDAADLFESRNSEYGDAYKDHPKIMYELLGEIELKTPEDYARYMRIGSIVGKLNRYAKNFNKGGHKDSADDLVVYAAMLAEITHEDS
jgi:hypothetical protein